VTSGTCLAVLVLAAQAPAPEPQATRPPIVFPAGTELVTVDVVVVDEKGRPVQGLTRQDFEVREDGQPREVTTFGFLSNPIGGCGSVSIRPGTDTNFVRPVFIPSEDASFRPKAVEEALASPPTQPPS